MAVAGAVLVSAVVAVTYIMKENNNHSMYEKKNSYI